MRTLTQEIFYKFVEDFFLQNRPFILFGTGTSCAVHPSFGMDALKRHLLSDIQTDQLKPEQRVQWEKMTSLLDKCDLETALNEVTDEELVNFIVESTAKLMIELDHRYGRKVQLGTIDWPAVAIFQQLLDGLQGNGSKLHAATTNYDLLAEYSFEVNSIPYTTGYYGNICREFNWDKAGRGLTKLERKPIKKKYKIVSQYEKHVRLYKVHGSINRFKMGESKVVENNAWIYNKPESVERLMITPGMSKHEKLHSYRTELLMEYDRAVEEHNAFLFLGFGFNDNQLIDTTISRKLNDLEVPGLILTRDETAGIKRFLETSKNLWLVCKIPQKDLEGTLIYNKQYAGPLCFENKSLWKTEEFVKEFFGG